MGHGAGEHKHSNQTILALDTTIIFNQEAGAHEWINNYKTQTFHPDCLCWGPRRILETDERFRQILPYCVIKSPDGLYLTYRRAPSGGEDRLHGLMSIGFGGHIDMQDIILRNETFDPWDTIQNGLYRELNEELGIIVRDEITPIGIIASNLSPVDRVHMGIVFLHELTSPLDLSKIEDHISSPLWMPWETLVANRDQMESWSQYVLELLEDYE